MILAGLVLLSVGAVDLVRLAPGRLARGVLAAVGAVALFVVAGLVDAAGWGLVAIGLAGAWTAVVPRDGRGRAGLWPVAALAGVVVIAVAVAGAREDPGVLGESVVLAGEGGGTPLDLAVLVVGLGVFLCESANLAVRAALRGEAVPTDAAAGLKGGRLIGPLERLLVFSLTTTGAHTLLAAILAAKGIVRFPEISRDAGEGNRAEYFLVGSLVSWTLGVAAAFLVWWATAPR